MYSVIPFAVADDRILYYVCCYIAECWLMYAMLACDNELFIVDILALQTVRSCFRTRPGRVCIIDESKK